MATPTLTNCENVSSSHVHDDVAFSILAKLPLKSLKRFTYVNKSWGHLFVNSHFISVFHNKFLSEHRSFYEDTSLLLRLTTREYAEDPMAYPPQYFPSYLLFGERFENKANINWPSLFVEENIPIQILGSGINGILCLYQECAPYLPILWNPATEEFKFIPPSVSTRFSEGILQGFGYDYVRDDYKVIWRNHTTFYEDDHMWEIYSLKSDSWRKLDVDMPYFRDLWRHIGVGSVYLNGVCHWKGGTSTHDTKTGLVNCVVSFNLTNDVFFTTPLPIDIQHVSWEVRPLVVLNGFIAMISNCARTTSFHISVLGELGVMESWTKLFVVGPLPFVGHPIGVGKKGEIFFRKEDGDNPMGFILFVNEAGDEFSRKKDDQLVCYDLSSQTVEEIGIKGMVLCGQTVIYKENLSSIGGIDYKFNDSRKIYEYGFRI